MGLITFVLTVTQSSTHALNNVFQEDIMSQGSTDNATKKIAAAFEFFFSEFNLRILSGKKFQILIL